MILFKYIRFRVRTLKRETLRLDLKLTNRQLR